MIAAVLSAMYQSLKRDRGALVLGFVLPSVFFVIMAEIYSSTSEGDVKLRITIVDEVDSDLSRRLLRAVADHPTITQMVQLDDATHVITSVRSGNADIGLVVRADAEGLDTGAGFGPAPLLVLSDPARGVTVPMLMGVLRQSYFGRLPDVALANVVGELENQFLTLSAEQSAAIGDGLEDMREDADRGLQVGWSFDDLVEVDTVVGGKAQNLVAYSAGGLAFMFVLFASVQGAMSILEERGNGIQDRILAGPSGVGVYVAGKYLFLVAQSWAQFAVMFAVAALVYDVDVLGHLLGWAVVSAAAGVAAAGFAVALVASCRTPRQAQAVSSTSILVLSALGGSMVPRFFMPEIIRDLGWLTPNTWVLEAFSDLFWREAPLGQLALPVALLVAFGVAALAVAVSSTRRRAYGDPA